MRLVVVLCLVASVLSEPIPSYHAEVGIPAAERIRVNEQRMAVQQQRIVGGSPAPANEHPYLAGLMIDLVGTSTMSVCSATVVSASRLVTAAHCWFDGTWQATRFHVVLGSLTLFTGGVRMTTDEVISFNTYNPATLTHDIAMIYLPSSVTFSDNIAPVALPEGIELFLTFEGQTAMAAGFGRTSDQQTGIPTNISASHVPLRIVSSFDCQAVYGFQVTEWNLCTDGQGGVGLCGGDSGGPLVVRSGGRRVLAGVSSFTFLGGCQAGFPSGFTRVTSYVNFIRQHM